jgi:N-acetylglucosamine-6-phosphate deacetylase
MELVCRHYKSAESFRVDLAGTRAALEPCRAPSPLVCAPVFVDIQINGHSGTDFSRPSSLETESIRGVVQALWRQGVGFFLPTVVTGSVESTRRSLERLVAALEDPVVGRAVPGFHLEGPYISPEDGPRGAHPREHVRPPSWDEFSRLQEAAGGHIKLVTLAPELPGAISFIERLREENVLVAIGHTGAGSREIADAVAAGARLSTHLGNGAHATLRRHPNYLWDQLACDDLWASLIVDGHHLPPAVVKTMVRAKGVTKCLLVSDAAPVAGLPPGRYGFAGQEVELTREGKVRLSGTEFLAGSALELPDAVHKVVEFAGLDPATAIDMASLHPAALLEEAGLELDLWSERTFTVLRQDEEELAVIATVIEGEVRWLERAPQASLPSVQV